MGTDSDVRVSSHFFVSVVFRPWPYYGPIGAAQASAVWLIRPAPVTFE